MRKEQYSKLLGEVKVLLHAYKKRSRVYLILKLATFIPFIYWGWGYFTNDYLIYKGIISIVALLFYILVMYLDAKLQKRTEYAQHYQEVLAREIAYLEGDFSELYPGDEFVASDHPFSYDLDLFGEQALFQRIDRTISELGRELLADELSNLSLTAPKIRVRQKSIAELTKLDSWRLTYLTHGKGVSFNLKKLLNIESISVTKECLSGKFAQICMLLLPITTISTLILSILDYLPGSISGLLFAIQILICILYAKVLQAIALEIGGLFKGFSSYRAILNMLTDQQFESEELLELQKKFWIDEKSNVLTSFGRLSKILDSLDQRGNLIIFILTNGLYLRDLWLVRSYFIWRKNSRTHLKTWVETLAKFDALISMSTYAYNHPTSNYPEILDDQTPVFDAKGCYHPFIAKEVAVPNDFNLDNANFAIVTGANMAGKSTFLRAVGINMVLALNGMPVCAEDLKVSVVKLFSSMRTSDNLVKNMSYFNAELTRLGSLITYCKQHRHTLIILDEILKGTNSKDKLNGSRLFLSEISKLPVTGIIATHDLALSELSSVDSRFKNYSFEIELSDNIDYTYKISKGVAVNMNATHLLEQIIKRIDD